MRGDFFVLMFVLAASPGSALTSSMSQTGSRTTQSSTRGTSSASISSASRRRLSPAEEEEVPAVTLEDNSLFSIGEAGAETRRRKLQSSDASRPRRPEPATLFREPSLQDCITAPTSAGCPESELCEKCEPLCDNSCDFLCPPSCDFEIVLDVISFQDLPAVLFDFPTCVVEPPECQDLVTLVPVEATFVEGRDDTFFSSGVNILGQLDRACPTVDTTCEFEIFEGIGDGDPATIASTYEGSAVDDDTGELDSSDSAVDAEYIRSICADCRLAKKPPAGETCLANCVV